MLPKLPTEIVDFAGYSSVSSDAQSAKVIGSYYTSGNLFHHSKVLPDTTNSDLRLFLSKKLSANAGEEK